jgi:hypothetical protein
MRYWLAAAVMFCVALAALYLPPREPHRRESAAHRPPEIRARQQVEEKLAAAVWVTRVLEQRDSLLRTAAQTGLLEGDTIALMLDPGLPPLFQTLFSRFLEEPRRLMQDYPRLGPLTPATPGGCGWCTCCRRPPTAAPASPSWTSACGPGA